MGRSCDERLNDINDLRQDRDELFEQGDDGWLDKDDEWEKAWDDYAGSECCDDCNIEDANDEE